MVSTKKLIRMARKWQKIAAIGRKRISLPRNSSSVADKGHFVVYSNDQTRIVIPLVYLHYAVFRELFKMSEEEFGLPRDGPIRLPFDAIFIEYIISLLTRGLCQDLEQALLFSIASSHCSLPFAHQEEIGQQVVVCV